MNIFHFFQLFKTAFLNIDPAGIYKNNNKWGSLILNIASCTDSNCGLIRSPTESTAFQISKLVKEGGNDINIIESQALSLNYYELIDTCPYSYLSPRMRCMLPFCR